MRFFGVLAAVLLGACGRVAYEPMGEAALNDGGDGGDSAVGCPGFVPPPQAGGTTYTVSPAGADTNPGTAGLPFLTIQHAADVVAPGDTVIVEDGVYTGPSGG